MKKVIIFLSFLLTASALQAQQIRSYVQLSGGYTPTYTHGKSATSYMISGEYGKTWKWLDVGLSFDRIDRLNPHKTDFYLHITYLKPTESRDPMYSINGDEFKGVIRTACRLNARIDLIKLFVPDSRHAFKVGGGGGIEFVENVWSHYESKDLSAWSLHFTRGWSGNVKVLYEYALTPKLSLGAFYLLEFGEDFGLSIRRNF